MIPRITVTREGLLPFVVALPISLAIALVFNWLYQPSSVSFQPIPTTQVTIQVSVVGAVATPGVYELEDSSRLLDAVQAAGGFHSEADVDQLNLAQRLEDEETLRIPFLGDATPIANDFGIININTASFAELDSLPGIGEVLANRIITYRMENGDFASVDELVNIEGISQSMVDELRPWITV